MNNEKANRRIDLRLSTCLGLYELMDGQGVCELTFTMDANGVILINPVFNDGTPSKSFDLEIVDDIEGGQIIETTEPLSVTN